MLDFGSTLVTKHGTERLGGSADHYQTALNDSFKGRNDIQLLAYKDLGPTG